MAKREKLPIFEVEFIPAERRLLERRDDTDTSGKLPQDKRHSVGRRTEDKLPSVSTTVRKTKKPEK